MIGDHIVVDVSVVTALSVVVGGVMNIVVDVACSDTLSLIDAECEDIDTYGYGIASVDSFCDAVMTVGVTVGVCCDDFVVVISEHGGFDVYMNVVVSGLITCSCVVDDVLIIVCDEIDE